MQCTPMQSATALFCAVLVDERSDRGFTLRVRHVVGNLRRRFQECRSAGASLSTWRELQLEILETAKRLRRIAVERERALTADETGQSHTMLWTMLSEAFWVESDLVRLECMIEEILAELESNGVANRDTDP